jgi:hypothetical protein
MALSSGEPMSQELSRRQWLAFAAASGLISGPGKALAAEDAYPTMPSNDEIYSWIVQMWKLGDESPYRFRMPGTAADHAAAHFIADRFRQSKLENVIMETAPIEVFFPKTWTLSVNGQAMDCSFLPYTKPTGPQGVTGELVYVGDGKPETLKAKGIASLAGKIALVDAVTPKIGYANEKQKALFYTDADNTLANEPYTEGFPIMNQDAALIACARAGAAGFVMILGFRPRDNGEEYHGDKRYNHLLTSLTVSPAVGDKLMAAAAAGSARATLTLTVTDDQPANGKGHSFNLYGEVPGTTDETLVIMSHHDGGATNEGSGASCVMALADYYGRLPHRSRRKTLQFFLISAHFGLKGHLPEHAPKLWSLRDRIGCIMNMEMIAAHYQLRNGQYVRDGLVSPQNWHVTRGEPLLLDMVKKAVVAQKLDRVIVSTPFGGEGGHMTQEHMGPVIERIGFNAPEFSRLDTPETVFKPALRPTALAFVDICSQLDPIPLATLQALRHEPGPEDFPSYRGQIAPGSAPGPR